MDNTLFPFISYTIFELKDGYKYTHNKVNYFHPGWYIEETHSWNNHSYLIGPMDNKYLVQTNAKNMEHKNRSILKTDVEHLHVCLSNINGITKA